MLQAININKIFKSEGAETRVLNNISLEIPPGEFLSIVGRSGSGKTTLLNVLSTLMRPDGGELLYRGDDLTAMPEAGLNRLRHADFSVIFQFHHLVPYLTALENTLLPFMRSLKPASGELVQRAKDCLERVGLAGKENRLPGSFSGGEQQRVAIARALVKSSRILFADEPTGSLDKKTGEGIMNLIAELNREGLTVVMVTHDPQYAELAHRSVMMEDGAFA
ncbi:MAG TPA: ABC transporter ATP-binding protein [Desulfobacteraceae bacterium]|nr:ABC transporter ATP-binding protein [Desulfobacteraceae bacterium]